MPRRRPLALLGLISALAVQLWALYLTSPGPGAGFPVADKAVHMTLFGLPVLLAGAAGLRWPAVAGVLAIHAPVSELIQGRYLPDRSGDPWDLLADLVGITLACLWLRGRASRESAGR